MVEPPMCESHTSRDILTFHYQTIPLWKMDARPFVEQRAIPLYGLLPTMAGIDEKLLRCAIEQMIEYYGANEARLREELLCFQVLLRRARRLEEHEMQIVLERINMFDPLLEEDPWVQGLQAKAREAALLEGEAKGEIKGEIKGEKRGEIKGARATLAHIVQLRFPSLLNLAETQSSRLHEAEALTRLIGQIALCDDERTACKMLKALNMPPA